MRIVGFCKRAVSSISLVFLLLGLCNSTMFGQIQYFECQTIQQKFTVVKNWFELSQLDVDVNRSFKGSKNQFYQDNSKSYKYLLNLFTKDHFVSVFGKEMRQLSTKERKAITKDIAKMKARGQVANKDAWMLDAMSTVIEVDESKNKRLLQRLEDVQRSRNIYHWRLKQVVDADVAGEIDDRILRGLTKYATSHELREVLAFEQLKFRILFVKVRDKNTRDEAHRILTSDKTYVFNQFSGFMKSERFSLLDEPIRDSLRWKHSAMLVDIEMERAYEIKDFLDRIAESVRSLTPGRKYWREVFELKRQFNNQWMKISVGDFAKNAKSAFNQTLIDNRAHLLEYWTERTKVLKFPFEYKELWRDIRHLLCAGVANYEEAKKTIDFMDGLVQKEMEKFADVSDLALTNKNVNERLERNLVFYQYLPPFTQSFIQLCNQTKSRIRVASRVNFLGESTFAGWGYLNPGDCKKVRLGIDNRVLLNIEYEYEPGYFVKAYNDGRTSIGRMIDCEDVDFNTSDEPTFWFSKSHYNNSKQKTQVEEFEEQIRKLEREHSILTQMLLTGECRYLYIHAKELTEHTLNLH